MAYNFSGPPPQSIGTNFPGGTRAVRLTLKKILSGSLPVNDFSTDEQKPVIRVWRRDDGDRPRRVI